MADSLQENYRQESSWQGRRRMWLSGSCLLLVLLLALGICEWQGWSFLRQPLATQLSAKLQRQVSIGPGFRLHLLGGIDITTDTFSVAPASWQKTTADETGFFAARDIHLVLPYRSVLGAIRGDGEALNIRLLEAGHIEARLIREASGRANWMFGNPLAEKKSHGSAIPHFSHLIVKAGHLELQDAVSHLQVSAHARSTDGRAEKTPGLSVEAKGRFREKTFSAHASSPGLLPLIAPAQTHTPVALRAELETGGTILNFEGQATDLLNFGGLNGDFRLHGPSLAAAGDAVSATLPTTAAFAMKGHVQKMKSLWDIAVTEFSVGTTRLSGKFRYDTAALRPHLDGELRGSTLALVDLAPALGAAAQDATVPEASGQKETSADKIPASRNSTSAAASKKTAGHRLLPQRQFDIPSLQRMDADVDIKLERVSLGRLFAQELQPLEGQLTLAKGELKIEHLRANTADGELRGQLLLDSRQKIPLWSANLQWSGVKLEKWLRPRNNFARESERIALKNPAGATQAPPFVSGQLGGQLQLRGSGSSTASMLSTLDGSVQVWVKNGAISQLLMEGVGLDAAQALGLLLRGDRNVDLRCAVLSLKAEKGTLHSETGIVDSSDTLLLMSGDISLAAEKIDLTLRAKPHDSSLLSLRAPLHVTGSFAAPRIRPDGGTVAMKVGAAALLGIFMAPLAALLPLIDPEASSTSSGCQETLAILQKKTGASPGMKQAPGIQKKR